MRQSASPVGDSTPAGLAANRQEILAGLMAAQKQLEPKYLYDERGSRLFDEICTLPEYYPTRTEVNLLRTNAAAIASFIGPRAEVLELGAGSSLKASLLLGCLDEPAIYVPVDISADYLEQQAAEVAALFPRVMVRPVLADFTDALALPRPLTRERTVVFFPGSTIGNLSRRRAAALLSTLAEQMRGGALLLGVDICKDAATLHAAYNDSRGVTAAFNLNLLARLNRELDADFELDAFEHDAVYDLQNERIEMRLVSQRDQVVNVAGMAILFRKGEYIISEHSHKYDPDDLARMATAAGWRLDQCWIDDSERFSLQYLRAPTIS